jgi:hypothetical protein
VGQGVPEAAERDYGVVLTGADLDTRRDEEADTSELRARLAGDRGDPRRSSTVAGYGSYPEGRAYPEVDAL